MLSEPCNAVYALMTEVLEEGVVEFVIFEQHFLVQGGAVKQEDTNRRKGFNCTLHK